MLTPAVSTIDLGIAQHFKWHLSPEDFEDSPPVFAFGQIQLLPLGDAFSRYGYEDALAQDRLPTLLTGHSTTTISKIHLRSLSKYGAPQPEFVEKPETCFLDVGSSYHDTGDMGEISEAVVDEAHLVSDTGAKEKMCDYCCVREASCTSSIQGNPETYCDVCGFYGDERWNELQKSKDGKAFTFSQTSPPFAKEGRKKRRTKKWARELEDQDADANSVDSWVHGTTTVMIKNIPAKYIVEELVSEMVTKEFNQKFDYLYLPIDFKSKNNKGYAFINFISSEEAMRFHSEFNGMQLMKHRSQKTIQVIRAHTQGLKANVEARHTSRIHNAWFRPMTFETEQESPDT